MLLEIAAARPRDTSDDLPSRSGRDQLRRRLRKSQLQQFDEIRHELILERALAVSVRRGDRKVVPGLEEVEQLSAQLFDIVLSREPIDDNLQVGHHRGVELLVFDGRKLLL